MTERHPWNRITAWLIDWLCICIWVAVLGAIGGTLYALGITRGADPGVINLVAFVILIAPATLWLTWRESGASEATPGKRVRRLRVLGAASGGRVHFGRALLRNTLKIAVPWELGHTVVFLLVGTTAGVPAWLVVLTVVAYALPIAYLVTLFVGDGRTPYDRLARTVVTRSR